MPSIGMAISIDPDLFYTVTPAGNSAELWTIDPNTGNTALAIALTLPGGETPDFRTNSIAFNPANQLYGWDTDNRQLFNIDYNSGQINYIGTPDVNAPRWINGMAFDQSGSLYGLAGSTDKLYTINTSTSVASVAGNSYVNVKHSGMAVDFSTGSLYSISGWQDNMPDYLLAINPNPTPVVNEVHDTNTTGSYSWTTQASGTGYSYDSSAGTIHMDGTGFSCGGNWCPASVQSEREMAIPSSGYAKLDFDIIGDGAGQSRIILLLKEDDNTMYSFKITDDTYGSSGFTQGVTKKVGGLVVDQHNGVGTVALGGNETGNTVNSINESVVVEIWWSPTHLKLVVNGVLVKDLKTSDTTIIDPSKLVVKSYRFNTDWNSIEVQPGVAQIIAELGNGIDFYGVGAEFDPATGNLFTIRDSNYFLNVDLLGGDVSEIGRLDGIFTTNLAAPYPYPQGSTPVPEPGTLALFGAGLAGLLLRKRRKHL